MPNLRAVDNRMTYPTELVQPSLDWTAAVYSGVCSTFVCACEVFVLSCVVYVAVLVCECESNSPMTTEVCACVYIRSEWDFYKPLIKHAQALGQGSYLLSGQPWTDCLEWIESFLLSVLGPNCKSEFCCIEMESSDESTDVLFIVAVHWINILWNIMRSWRCCFLQNSRFDIIMLKWHQPFKELIHRDYFCSSTFGGKKKIILQFLKHIQVVQDGMVIHICNHCLFGFSHHFCTTFSVPMTSLL